MRYQTKKLGDVLNYEQPTKYIVNSTDYSDSYETPVLTAGKTFVKGYTNEEENIFPADKLPVIIFDDFTTASQLVDFKFKVKSSAMKILHAKKGEADIKYIFYIMQTIKHNHVTHKRYWISEYSKIEIPLPPLAEQKKIVAKLEKLLAKVNEAKKLRTEAQIAASQLLHAELHKIFEEGKKKGWEEKTFEDALVFKTGKLDSNAMVPGGKYPFFTCAQKTYEIDSYSFDQKAVLLAGNNAAGKYSVKFYDGKFDAYQRTYVISVKDETELDYTFLTSYISYILNDLKELSVGANTKFLTMRILNGLKIPIPPLSEQKKIIARLDSISEKTKQLQGFQEATADNLISLDQSILSKAFSEEFV